MTEGIVDNAASIALSFAGLLFIVWFADHISNRFCGNREDTVSSIIMAIFIGIALIIAVCRA